MQTDAERLIQELQDELECSRDLPDVPVELSQETAACLLDLLRSREPEPDADARLRHEAFVSGFAHGVAWESDPHRKGEAPQDAAGRVARRLFGTPSDSPAGEPEPEWFLMARPHAHDRLTLEQSYRKLAKVFHHAQQSHLDMSRAGLGIRGLSLIDRVRSLLEIAGRASDSPEREGPEPTPDRLRAWAAWFDAAFQEDPDASFLVDVDGPDDYSPAWLLECIARAIEDQQGDLFAAPEPEPASEGEAEALRRAVRDHGCGHCVRCLSQVESEDLPGLSVADMQMIVCPRCGNKRCPHAEWHGYVCTGSDAPNQTPTPSRGAAPIPETGELREVLWWLVRRAGGKGPRQHERLVQEAVRRLATRPTSEEADRLLLETLGWLEGQGFEDKPGTFNGLIGRLRQWRDQRRST